MKTANKLHVQILLIVMFIVAMVFISWMITNLGLNVGPKYYTQNFAVANLNHLVMAIPFGGIFLACRLMVSAILFGGFMLLQNRTTAVPVSK